MILKPGDRVSFLNDTGGGIVTRIIDENLVHVTIEDGFEIPVLARELIKTGGEEMASEIARAHQQLLAKKDEIHVNDDLLPLYISHNNPQQRPNGLYMAFVPKNQDNPLTGPLEVILVNHTDYSALFSLFLNYAGNYNGSEYGIIEPSSQLNLGSIESTEIEKWANALWQNVFFVEGKGKPVAPFSGLINFRPVKLYREENYLFEGLLRKKAFFVEIARLSHLLSKPFLDEKVSPESIRALEEKISQPRKASMPETRQPKESFLDKHKIDDKIAEVDLHIGELVENFTNLDNADMLFIQLDYFKNCMKQADTEKIQKIIFIHGVGNGKLKTEIHNLLKEYDGIEFYDAPYARYGLGATEVNFYRNK